MFSIAPISAQLLSPLQLIDYFFFISNTRAMPLSHCTIVRFAGLKFVHPLPIPCSLLSAPIAVSRRCVPFTLDGYEHMLQGIINLSEMVVAIDNLKMLATINGVCRKLCIETTTINARVRHNNCENVIAAHANVYV